MGMITVECSDGALIEVDRNMATTMSGAISRYLEENPSLEEGRAIPLENITSKTLVKVLEFCSVHSAPHTVPNLTHWDEKFVRLEPGELCELASAAYHLEIKPLVDLTCKAIAKLLKGKSPAEIRKIFNILYDFQPGDDVPPPTMRDKLRNKLVNGTKKKETASGTAKTQAKTTAGTADALHKLSVEELLLFIDGPSASSSSSSSSSSANSSPTTTKKKNKKKKSKLKKNTPTHNTEEKEIAGQSKDNNQKETQAVNPPVEDIKEAEGPPLRESAADTNLRALEDSLLADWESEDDSIDPALKAQQDKEVEEFRLRLEGIQRNETRPKVTLPSSSIELLLNSVHISR